MRVGEWAEKYGVHVVECEGAPGEVVLKVRDIFTTRNGSWDPNGDPGSVPAWARAEYLKPSNHPQYNADGGADHHLFGAVRVDTGYLQPFGTFHFYTYTDNQNHSDQRVKLSGWANIPIFGHSDIPGPWAWHPKLGRPADEVRGGGLPGGLHVSWYVVWEAVTIPLPPKPEEPKPEEPSSLEARVLKLEIDVELIKRQLAQMGGG